MVFCDRISIDGEHAVYRFGASPERMSGLVRFYQQSPRFVVERKPEEDVPENRLARIWMKYQEALSKGVFPDKMAIQIG